MDFDFGVAFVRMDKHCAFFKPNDARFVVINDCDTCLGILTFKSLVGLWIIYFDKEVFIFFITIVIDDFDADGFDLFVGSKHKFFVN